MKMRQDFEECLMWRIYRYVYYFKLDDQLVKTLVKSRGEKPTFLVHLADRWMMKSQQNSFLYHDKRDKQPKLKLNSLECRYLKFQVV